MEYDSDGRLIRQCDRSGACVVFEHDPDTGTERITDRTGRVTTYTYDDAGRVLTKTDGRGSMYTNTYDASGNRTSMIDRVGARTNWTYDARGNELTKTIDATGAALVERSSYNANNQMLTFTNPAGEVMTYGRDSHGLVTSLRNHGGESESYTYSARGRPLTFNSADGLRTTYTWNAADRIASVADAAGRVTAYEWDVLGRMTKAVAASGTADAAVTQYVFTPNSKVEEIIDPLGSSTTFEYSILGQKIGQTDALGNTTRWELDHNGKVVRETYADGSSVAATYDAEGRELSTTDEAGRTSKNTYDAAGFLQKITNSDGTARSYTLDREGRILGLTDEEGDVATAVRNGRGLVTKITGSAGVMSFTYDAADRLATFIDGHGITTRYLYDSAGRPSGIVHGVGTADELTVTRDFSGGSKLLTEEDRLGRVVDYGYDGSDNLTKVTDDMSNVWTYGYDGRGNLTSILDPSGRTTKRVYDLADHLTGLRYPSGATESFTYDAAGNLTARVDADGGRTTVTVDARGRPTKVATPGGSVYGLVLNRDGSRATTSDGRGVSSYDYDDRGRLESITMPDGASVTFTWDGASRLVSRTVRVGAVSRRTSFAYEGGRLDSVTDPEGGVTTYVYNAGGSLAEVLHANGVTSTYEYDGMGRLESVIHRDAADVPLLGSTVTRVGGEVVREDDVGGATTTYDHDLGGRLVSAERVGAGAYHDVFTYDGAGNVTAATRDGVPETWRYDADGRLIARGAATYTWDATGRLTGRDDGEVSAFTWDGARMDTASVGASDVELVYDVDGLLVARIEDGTEVRYLWDPTGDVPRLLAAYTAGGVLLQHYVHDAFGPIQVHEGGVVSTVLRDRAESVRGLTDEGGDLSDTYVYDAYGQPVSHAGAADQPFGFGSMMWDPTLDLYYAVERWYEPTSGRFVSRDPVLGDPTQPLTTNPYLFGRGDPVHYLDPSGQFSLCEMSTAIAIVTILHTVIDGAFALAALNQALYHIYGQRGRAPLRWNGVLARVSKSIGVVGGQAWLFEGLATNTDGMATEAGVLFLMGGLSVGVGLPSYLKTPIGGRAGRTEIITFNWGQPYLHPEYTINSAPNPYPMEGFVTFLSAFSVGGLFFSFTGISQMTVWSGIAPTAYVTSDGFSWGFATPKLGLMDMMVGESWVLWHTP
jgi:RHS repeat-associated protein